VPSVYTRSMMTTAPACDQHGGQLLALLRWVWWGIGI